MRMRRRTAIFAVALALAAVSVYASARQANRPQFPADARVAYVSVPAVIEGSQLGRSLGQKVIALQEQKVKELERLQQSIRENQAKLGSGLLEQEARARLEREMERQQLELQRAQQDAQLELQNLQADLEEEFNRALRPAIDNVAAARKLHMLLAAGAGILWADPALDLTPEVIARLDGGK
jgi:Skp family chaperone for outer membrane proteins